MGRVEPFAVEQWMDAHETTAKYNIAETCAASISLQDLANLSASNTNPQTSLSFSKKLTYGPIRGSDELRTNIASQYEEENADELPKENILVTAGAIQANFLTLYALTGPGDHVICMYPTYQQLYSVPRSLGAEVSLWRLKEESGFMPDVDELRAMVRPETKVIIINNPNNPTGVTFTRNILQQVVDIAKAHQITVMSDEVYRPLFHSLPSSAPDPPPSMLSMGYEKTIATGSMSKAYAMAGIRLGWIASRDRAIIEKCAEARDYTTISVSQLDDHVAAFALSKDVMTNLLERNAKLAASNLKILSAFVEDHSDVCSWVRPTAGTTSFIKFSRDGRAIDDVAFSEDLQNKTGAFVCPGSRCFGGDEDFKGYVRIGYVCEEEELKSGLEQVAGYLGTSFRTVAWA
ncbi:MAG: hypothetical protein M1817_000094 [Caeruleum heppii]|nr:MAG: hypothetical protein M1817_000094 [Caeruleum heppii]